MIFDAVALYWFLPDVVSEYSRTLLEYGYIVPEVLSS